MPAAEDAVFEAIRGLVTERQYLDNLPGLADRALSGGGWLRKDRGGARRRMYRRGSPEHVAARRAGLMEPLPALVSASPENLEEVEALLGHRLPSLLRRLYSEVGNGGFGPGYGILGLRGGHRDDMKRTATDVLIDARSGSQSAWSFLPDALFPICYWGCAIYSFTDCSTADGEIWGWDPNPGPVGAEALFSQGRGLTEWLERWLAGRLHQPALVEDPVGHWRGATDEEIHVWLPDP